MSRIFDLDEVTIIGSEGTLGLRRHELRMDPPHQGRGNDELYNFETPEHVAMPFIQTVVDELNGKAKSPADATSAANGNSDVR